MFFVCFIRVSKSNLCCGEQSSSKLLLESCLIITAAAAERCWEKRQTRMNDFALLRRVYIHDVNVYNATQTSLFLLKNQQQQTNHHYPICCTVKLKQQLKPTTKHTLNTSSRAAVDIFCFCYEFSYFMQSAGWELRERERTFW